MTTLPDALRTALAHPDPHLDADTLADLVAQAEREVADDVAGVHAAATAVVAEAEAEVRATTNEVALTEAALVRGARDLLVVPDSGVGTVTAETQCARVRRTARDRWDVSDARIERPSSPSAIAASLARARSSGQRVRVVGSARSLSTAPQPARDGALLSTCDLDQVGTIAAAELRDGVDPALLYRAGAGRVLADVLQDLAGRGVGLPDMGSGDFQALAGALSTATHGSGVDKPAFPSMVRALDVVAFDGAGCAERLRVEPRDGPTDPDRFAGADADGSIRLVQDDDTFDAWLVSLGCLGVITAVTVQAVPAFWLSETRTLGWWSALRDTLGHEIASVPYFEVLLSPWATVNPSTGEADHAVLITRRMEVPEPPRGRPEGGRPIAMRLAQLPVGRIAAQIALLHALADPLRRVPGLLRTGTTATQVHRYVDRAPEVLLLRLDLNAQSSELAIPLAAVDGAVSPNNAIAAAERLLELAATRRAAWERRFGGQPGRPPRDELLEMLRDYPLHTSPIALRFTAAGRGMLAMQHGAPTCLIEMPMPGVDLLDRRPDPDSTLGALYAAYDQGRSALFAQAEARLGLELGARPHWGQRNAVRWDDVVRLYPRAAAWRSAYDRFNVDGVFDGPMTDQLGISRGG
jgi:L-gulono-1,4-lactone dehydrogenase